ncbi:MAG TPA: hypothetical protein VK363_00820 [Pyrinomonadaceae bacterium]|nr:hypothetical protein [Pyrinomonadaceae bacterium]
MSALLYIFNIALIRWYEGYPWKDTWFGRLRTLHYQKKYVATQDQIKGMRTLLRETRVGDEHFKDDAEFQRFDKILEHWKTFRGYADVTAVGRRFPLIWEEPAERVSNEAHAQWKQIWLEIRAEFTTLRRNFNRDFPWRESLILPTRLGNIIRSFEFYADREYGIDSVELYTRLSAKIDKDYASRTDDAKTNFDFMMNCSVLSALIFVLLLAAGLSNPSTINSPRLFALWLFKLALAAVAARVMYLLSLPQAVAWGQMVKGAFDLYRNELLGQLGYTREKITRKEEWELWDKISLKMIFGDIYETPLPEYSSPPPPAADPPTFARGNPADVKLELTKGGTLQNSRGYVTVVVQVRNTDAKRGVDGVVVTDTLPDGWRYVWDSVAVDTGEVKVSGVNPYRFNITSLGPDEEVILTYQAVIEANLESASLPRK